MEPIDRSIFAKMLFCDQIFQFIELEESLYFTALDVEFHSFGKGEEISEEKLIDLNKKHLSAMTFNLSQVREKSDTSGLNKPLDQKETQDLIEKSLYENKYASDSCYRKLSQILFDQDTSNQSSKPKDIFERMADKEAQNEVEVDSTLDTEKLKKYEKNYLFCHFNHLFEYEATYYSYLIAKLQSHKLFNDGLQSKSAKRMNILSRGTSPMTKREVDLIFARGGETNN